MTGQPALTPYVPRLLLRHLDETPDAAVRSFDGTLVFIDVSGFTQLSERLARQGREGAERLAGAIGRCFTTLLTVAYESGGGLLKFGGDALLLLFDGDGHAERACGRRPACAAPCARPAGSTRAASGSSCACRSASTAASARSSSPAATTASCWSPAPPRRQVVRMESRLRRPVRSSSATTRRHACPPLAPGPRPARDGCSAARRPRRRSPAAASLAPSGRIAWSRRSRLSSGRICRPAPAPGAPAGHGRLPPLRRRRRPAGAGRSGGRRGRAR